jgi:hypothetical protein
MYSAPFLKITGKERRPALTLKPKPHVRPLPGREIAFGHNRYASFGNGKALAVFIGVKANAGFLGHMILLINNGFFDGAEAVNGNVV